MDSKNKSIARKFRGSWEHPDIRLSNLIVQALASGIKPSRLADWLQISTKTLKEHYSIEMEDVKGLLGLDMQLILADKAHDMQDDPKNAMKAAIHLHNFAKNKDQQGRDQQASLSKAEEEAKNLPSFIDPKKLSISEMRDLMKLMDKAKTDNHNVLLEAKADVRGD